MAKIDAGIVDGMSKGLLYLGTAVFVEGKVDGLVATCVAIRGIKRTQPRTVPVEIGELD